MKAFASGDIATIPPLSRPRRRGSAHSMASGIAAVYSPPRNTPPIRRSATNIHRVPTPATSWLGMRAISSVVIAMPAMATLVVEVRPR